MTSNERAAAWWDRDAGPVVRPYAMTGGRVPAAARFDVVATVRAAPLGGALPPDLQPEHRQILAAARSPITVADLAAELDLALGVVQVLLHDLAVQELICLHEPGRASAVPDENVLKAVVNGLRAL
ncbi:hypothetical protein GCM10010124_34320 [Pilimelia terevasa]|uniref:DUF742 domain-containing protein n=1 Tax=Pilimelia terevasa TaxID=53372 RepID=A0A8J3FKC6_9ACTN|nr:DUF742 domain-containing protein [Pilimelia terevasa]GGK38670.1 hypothetical protein GCM10010124_34320 [Pilimelia terevasa]